MDGGKQCHLNKDNMSKENGVVALNVISVIKMKWCLTCCLVAVLLKLFGPRLLIVLGLRMYPKHYNKARCGVRNGSRMDKSYTFGIVVACWAVWKTRNDICFEGKIVNNSVEIVCYACSLMRYWACAYMGRETRRCWGRCEHHAQNRNEAHQQEGDMQHTGADPGCWSSGGWWARPIT